MDPLQTLRETIQSQQPITYLTGDSAPCDSLQTAAYIALGSNGAKFPKVVATRYQRPGQQERDWTVNPGSFYSLQAVVIAYQLKESNTADYLKKTRDAGVTAFVSSTDRAPLVAWLEGKSSTLDRLVSSADGSTTPTGSPSASTRALPSASQSQTLDQGASSSGPIPLEKRPYVPDAKDIQAVKKIRLGEVEIRDRNSVLRGTKINDFTNVKNIIADRVKVAKDTPKPQQAASGSKSDPNAAKKKSRNAVPIIMISSSPTALVTMYNVRKFLEDAEFEGPEDAKRRMASEGNSKLDDVIPIYRKKDTALGAGGASAATTATERPIKYLVVDGVEALSKFGPEAWDRVICVMTTGQAWQFKSYKWPDPTQLFHHVKGIHVAWANDPPNPRVKDWNVSDIKIDPIRRHVDKMTVANFWMQIDEWVQHNKPSLMA
ncbi:CDC73-domain-containing protein [Clavulina sp. PMI_390]|nr:CDC73-domain-containing protein [Clavulina sp. PMI_390]